MSKQVTGLDSGQVTTWTSWHRWTAISLLAAAFLAAAAAWQRARDGSTAADPRHRSRAAQAAPRHGHSLAPPRQGPPRRVVPLATPPPVSRPPGPPALARLRGRAAAAVTNYNCGNCGC